MAQRVVLALLERWPFDSIESSNLAEKFLVRTSRSVRVRSEKRVRTSNVDPAPFVQKPNELCWPFVRLSFFGCRTSESKLRNLEVLHPRRPILIPAADFHLEYFSIRQDFGWQNSGTVTVPNWPTSGRNKFSRIRCRLLQALSTRIQPDRSVVTV